MTVLELLVTHLNLHVKGKLSFICVIEDGGESEKRNLTRPAGGCNDDRSKDQPCLAPLKWGKGSLRPAMMRTTVEITMASGEHGCAGPVGVRVRKCVSGGGGR